MLSIRYLLISVIGFILFLGAGFFVNRLQAFPLSQVRRQCKTRRRVDSVI